MSDSDEDDLFAPKATRCGRQVKQVAKFNASGDAPVASALESCDFLQKMIKEERARAQIAKKNGIETADLYRTDKSPPRSPPPLKGSVGTGAAALAMDETVALARSMCQEAGTADELTAREGATGQALFQPVPSICPAPMTMHRATLALLQNSAFPGSAGLIQRLMLGRYAAGDSAPDCMLEQWMDAVLALSRVRSERPGICRVRGCDELEAVAPFFFRLAAFHASPRIAHKAVVLAARSLRPGKAAPWAQGDFVKALSVYGLNLASLPRTLAALLAGKEATCSPARYATGAPVQVKYEQGWFDGHISAFTDGIYTVLVQDEEGQDAQEFEGFPDEDVRPLTPLIQADCDEDDFVGNSALCSHLLHWLWLFQIVLRHEGGMELTVDEAVGVGGWLDLMCGLRVEPNVVFAPSSAYAPRAPLPGMATSVSAAVEECARLLLVRSAKSKEGALSTAVACFCGQGMVTDAAARMLLYQHVVPCSAQGDLLRRAIMSHELHAVFGATRSRLFPPGTVSEGVADGKGGNRACLEEGVQMKEPGELGRVWSGEELMQAMRQIVVRRASKQVSVGGSQIGSEDLSRLLVFLLHCTEDALPKCSSSRQGRQMIRELSTLVGEWLQGLSMKGECGSYAQLAVRTNLQALQQTLDRALQSLPGAQTAGGSGMQASTCNTILSAFSVAPKPDAWSHQASARKSPAKSPHKRLDPTSAHGKEADGLRSAKRSKGPGPK